MSNSTYFKIEGKLVTLIEERSVRTCELDSWLAALTQSTLQTTPLLPQGCRMYSKGANGLETYVIEQAPARRTVTWKSERPWGQVEKPEHKWRLAFPYMVFIAQPQVPRLFVYYRKAPLSQSDDRLLKCNLGNIYHGTNNVCMAPLGREFNALALTDSCERVTRLIGAFWSSEFNADLLDNFLAAARADKRVETLMKWEEESAANPLFPLEVEWLEAGCTLAAAVNSHPEV